MQHLDLDVRVDPRAGTVGGTATWTARRLSPTTDRFELHQVDLAISEVRVDGVAVEGWLAAKDRLSVPVPQEAEQVEVAVDYDARPKTGMQFRGRSGAPPGEVIEAWTQGEGEDNRHWYPGWDYPNDKFSVRTHIEASPDLVALGNGIVEATARTDDGWARTSFWLERPIPNYLVAVAVGDYAVTDAEGPVPLQYAVPRGTPASTVARTFDRTAPQISFLAELLDEPFPYPVYRQVTIQRFQYGGMENAALTTLNDNRLLGSPDEPPFRADETIAHEIAHQWFGDLITCYGWRELWLNEGFAEFYAGRWQEHDQGPERYAHLLIDDWHPSALRSSQAPMAARAHTKVQGRENAGVYVKGASVLHQLRVHLGDEVFDQAIRTYIDEHRDRLAETEDLRRVLEDVSGEHLGWLFDQWVTGVGNAALEASHTFADGQLRVTIQQPGGAFVVPVQVEVGTESEVSLHRLWAREGRTELSVPMDTPPLWVAVNPDGGALAAWTITQTDTQWAAQATRSPRAFARLQAIEHLGSVPASDITHSTLSTLVADRDEPPTIRQHAALALGHTHQTDALPALRAALSDPESRVRNAAAEGLGTLGQADGLSALLGTLRSDRAPDVRAKALSSVGKLDPDRGRLLARRYLSSPDSSSRSYVHRVASRLLREHGAPSDLGVLTSKLVESRVRSAHLDAAAAAAADIASELEVDDPTRARVARRLDALLDSDAIDTQRSALRWLGQAGDLTSARALDAFAQRNHVDWGELSRRARAAARAIRAAEAADSEQAPPDEKDLEQLRAELEELNERVEDLEIFR